MRSLVLQAASRTFLPRFAAASAIAQLRVVFPTPPLPTTNTKSRSNKSILILNGSDRRTLRQVILISGAYLAVSGVLGGLLSRVQGKTGDCLVPLAELSIQVCGQM